jgi:hypothetical protein
LNSEAKENNDIFTFFSKVPARSPLYADEWWKAGPKGRAATLPREAAKAQQWSENNFRAGI